MAASTGAQLRDLPFAYIEQEHQVAVRKLVMQTGKGVRTSCTYSASSIRVAYVERMRFRRVQALCLYSYLVQVTKLHEVS